MFSRKTIELDVEHVGGHGGQLPCTCLSRSDHSHTSWCSLDAWEFSRNGPTLERTPPAQGMGDSVRGCDVVL